MSEQTQTAVAAPESTSVDTPQENSSTEAAPEGAEARLEELEAKPDLSSAEKKEQVNLKKKFQLKIDGNVEDFEIDLANEEELKKHLQMSRASAKRMKESAEIRKAAEEFLEVLQKDPRKIMKELGINEKELAQLIMNEELAEMEKSPEQKEIEKLTKQLEEIQETKKKEEEERKKSEFERMKSDAEARIETDISSALETGGIPKTPYTVKKMAEFMYAALENDLDLKPSDVVPLVRKQIEAEIKELFAVSSDDVLEEMLKDQMPRLRKRSVDKAKRLADTAKNIKEVAPGVSNKEEEKKISINDFLRGAKLK